MTLRINGLLEAPKALELPAVKTAREIPEFSSASKANTIVPTLNSTGTAPKKLSRAQQDFIFHSVAHGASDVPLQVLATKASSGRSVLTNLPGNLKAGAAALVAVSVVAERLEKSGLTHVITDPSAIPMHLKLPLALGVAGADAIGLGPWIDRVLPLKIRGPEVSALLGPPPGSENGTKLTTPIHQDNSPIPSYHAIDPKESNGGGRASLSEDADLNTHAGGPRVNADLGHVEGREAVNRLGKDENILWNEEKGPRDLDPSLANLLNQSIKDVKTARSEINKRTGELEVGAEGLVISTIKNSKPKTAAEVSREITFREAPSPDGRKVEYFFHRPQIEIDGEKIDALGAVGIDEASGSVHGVYTKYATSVPGFIKDQLTLIVPHDKTGLGLSGQLTGGNREMVGGVLKAVYQRYGTLPEGVVVALPSFQGSAMSEKFRSAQEYDRFLEQLNDNYKAGKITLDQHGQIMRSPALRKGPGSAALNELNTDVLLDPVVGRNGVLNERGYQFRAFTPDEPNVGNTLLFINREVILDRKLRDMKVGDGGDLEL